MENHHTQQSEPSARQTKKGNGGKRLLAAISGLGIIAAVIGIIRLNMFADTSSRFSTPLEIAEQEEHQAHLDTAQEEFQQKLVEIMKEEQEKSDSILKSIEHEDKYLYGK